jgi:hypothetical protein
MKISVIWKSYFEFDILDKIRSKQATRRKVQSCLVFELEQLLVHRRQHVQEPGVLPALPAGDGCAPQPLDPQPGEDSQPPSVELQLNIPGTEANYSNN